MSQNQAEAKYQRVLPAQFVRAAPLMPQTKVQQHRHKQDFPFPLPALYHPALLLSLALHGLFFLIPLPDRSLTRSENLPSSEATITLTDLLASPNPARPAAPKPQPQVSASGKSTPKLAPKSTPRPAAQPRPPKPTGVPSTVAISSPSPTPAASAIVSPIPTPVPPSTPQPEASPDRVRPFFEQLASTAGVPIHPPSPDLFPDPSLYFEPTGAETTLKSNVLKAVWMDGKTPEQVYISVLNSQLQSGNFQTEQKPDYGGGTVYEIKQNDTVWYLNLVPTTDGRGTIIVVWQHDPSHPTPVQSP